MMRRRCQIATPGGWCETGGAVGVPCRDDDGGAAGDAARMRIPSRTFGSAHRFQRKIASARKQQRPASGTAPASTCGPPREGAETGTSQRGTAQRNTTASGTGPSRSKFQAVFRFIFRNSKNFVNYLYGVLNVIKTIALQNRL